ncbi:MAG: hypothetical protein NTY74_05480 [Ignavibacteriae bacterium]|nr:hypothetical protein [Ignavibacteriota bacterium]
MERKRFPSLEGYGVAGGWVNDRNVYLIFDILEEKSIRFHSKEGIHKSHTLPNPPRSAAADLKNRRIHPFHHSGSSTKEGINKERNGGIIKLVHFKWK